MSTRPSTTGDSKPSGRFPFCCIKQSMSSCTADHHLTDEPSIPLQSEVQQIRIDQQERSNFPVKCGSHVQTPYGVGYVTSMRSTIMEIALTSWTLSNGIHPTLYMDSSSAATAAIRTVQAEAARQILEQHSRSLALDMTPYLLFANGPAVSGLITSGVADYMEFKSLEGVYYCNEKEICPVPCSKNDVFASKLLSAMDKRRLMKFLQTALDFATAEAAQADVESWNEVHLNQGRSLSRPQNKAVVKNTDLAALQELWKTSSEIAMDFAGKFRWAGLLLLSAAVLEN